MKITHLSIEPFVPPGIFALIDHRSGLLSVLISCASSLLEPPRDKTNKVTVRPESTNYLRNSGRHQVHSRLIRVFGVRMKKAWVLSYPLCAQRRLRLAWVSAQSDLESSLGAQSLCWFCHVVAHIFTLGASQCRGSYIYLKPKVILQWISIGFSEYW